jgi:heat shock protein HslJ
VVNTRAHLCRQRAVRYGNGDLFPRRTEVDRPDERRSRLAKLPLIMLLLALAMTSLTAAGAAAQEFPYERELLLDTSPMKGTRRVPVFEVDKDGKGSIDLWCASVQTHFIVAGNTITILIGAKTERQCTPELMQADEEMVKALEAVTTWRRDGLMLTLQGGKTLRFRMATN